MASGYCLNCDNRIELGKKPFIGQSVVCKKCGTDLEVLEISPIELAWMYDGYEEIEKRKKNVRKKQSNESELFDNLFI